MQGPHRRSARIHKPEPWDQSGNMAIGKLWQVFNIDSMLSGPLESLKPQMLRASAAGMRFHVGVQRPQLF